MLVQLVIGIEHEVGLIIIGHTDVEHMPQQIRQRISLANQFKIVAFHHMAAQRPHHVAVLSVQLSATSQMSMRSDG